MVRWHLPKRLAWTLQTARPRRRGHIRDLRNREIGERVWLRFSQPREHTLWYYDSLADIFCKALPGQLSEELREIVDVLKQVHKLHNL
jgi:hypothetical protein